MGTIEVDELLHLFPLLLHDLFHSQLAKLLNYTLKSLLPIVLFAKPLSKFLSYAVRYHLAGVRSQGDAREEKESVLLEELIHSIIIPELREGKLVTEENDD
jgi:hypothetical protein